MLRAVLRDGAVAHTGLSIGMVSYAALAWSTARFDGTIRAKHQSRTRTFFQARSFMIMIRRCASPITALVLSACIVCSVARSATAADAAKASDAAAVQTKVFIYKKTVKGDLE